MREAALKTVRASFRLWQDDFERAPKPGPVARCPSSVRSVGVAGDSSSRDPRGQPDLHGDRSHSAAQGLANAMP